MVAKPESDDAQLVDAVTSPVELLPNQLVCLLQSLTSGI